jgi:GNAT superfamily N-acetyltransferase
VPLNAILPYRSQHTGDDTLDPILVHGYNRVKHNLPWGDTDTQANMTSHIRHLDAARDMPGILDLIEMGFGEELDPHGWKMLHRMRQLYQPNPLTRAVANVALEATGFVWAENGQILANLSLRKAYPRGARGRLIGNVVVHPDHRGRGIGRALMETAIEAAREQDAAWVGLEVRADNDVACQLYQHLGFRPVGITEHLVRPDGLAWPPSVRPQANWRRSRSQDQAQWRHLATLVHTYDQRLVLELRTDLAQSRGLEGWLSRWFNRQSEQARVHVDHRGAIDLAAHVETDRGYRYHNWDMLMHPGSDERGAQELVDQCLAATRRYPPWPVVTIVADQPVLLTMLQRAGFRRHRTLQQMILKF